MFLWPIYFIISLISAILVAGIFAFSEKRGKKRYYALLLLIVITLIIYLPIFINSALDYLVPPPSPDNIPIIFSIVWDTNQLLLLFGSPFLFPVILINSTNWLDLISYDTISGIGLILTIIHIIVYYFILNCINSKLEPKGDTLKSRIKYKWPIVLIHFLFCFLGMFFGVLILIVGG